MSEVQAPFEVEAGGKHWPVALTDRGRFVVRVGDVEVNGESREQLESKVRREVARQKIEHAIPVVLYSERRYVRAVLRGKHTRTSQYLFTIGTEKVAIEHPTIVARGEQVSEEQIAALNEAADAATAAEQRRRDLVHALGIREHYGAGLDGWKLLDEAEKQALGEKAG